MLSDFCASSPPTYKVWGKVVFSQASVILSAVGGSAFPQCHGQVETPQNAEIPQKEDPLIRQAPISEVQQAGGTHPTGTHACCPDFLLILKLAIVVLGVHYEHLNSN